MGLLDSIIKGYIESEWLNNHRQINEPMAREEIFGCGAIYVFENGSTIPQDTYQDHLLSCANAWPVIFDSRGRMPDIYFKSMDSTVTIKNRYMDIIAIASNVIL